LEATVIRLRLGASGAERLFGSRCYRARLTNLAASALEVKHERMRAP
jgi:hypothetical protein